VGADISSRGQKKYAGRYRPLQPVAPHGACEHPDAGPIRPPVAQWTHRSERTAANRAGILC